MKTALVVIICLAALLYGSQKLKGASSVQDDLIKKLDAKSFQELISKGQGVLVDVRTPQEIEDGFIKGAVFVNFFSKNFQKNILKVPKDKAVYLYCRSGGRSGKAAKFLIENGYENVYDLSGGFTAWKSKQLPISK
ncbi:rhodanese-like domain-containing protein [Flavicella sediminum]|uniref:rhodanese-like domain-containing protein n=1 Tax=Flavicella sediminum TaxID=2585141 RepID=UPI00140CA7D2|nr:rhodanese-like domain-containing protein [Flavicella sediminum]